MDPTIIHFHIYENVRSCYIHKKILLYHIKTRPLCMNLENFEKGKAKTRKSIVLKLCIISNFHSDYYMPEIDKLAFHITNFYIHVKNNCAGERYENFQVKKFY